VDRRDHFERQLADYDEALATDTPASSSASTSPDGDTEFRLQLERAKACLRLLERAWPRSGLSTAQCDSATRPGESADSIGVPEPSDLEPGRLSFPARFGDYRLLREIGRGGMGVVYEAEQNSLGRRVALKIVPFAPLMDPRHLQRFQNESRAAAALDHPQIVKIYAVGKEGGTPFHAMQLIRGRSLAEWIAEWRADKNSPNEGTIRTRGRARLAAELGMQACAALEHAHAQGVIHRDVKPANLLIAEGWRLYVADFGLARVADNPSLTTSGGFLGTLRYASPEQALGKGAVDHRTDVYSLGAALYELVSLKPMIPPTEAREILSAIANQAPPPLRRVAPAAPRDLETILLKATATEPAERYATAQQFADDLRRFCDHKPILARRPSLADRAGKWLRRNAALLSASLGTAALVLLIALVLVWREQRKIDAAQRQSDQYSREANEQRAN
jgi:serine/threonine protein kinase